MERISTLRSELKSKIGDSLLPGDEAKIQDILGQAINDKQIKFDVFGFNPIVMALQTALIAVDEIGLRRDGVIAIILYNGVINGYTTMEEVRNDFGDGVATIIKGLVRLYHLYEKTPVIETENFRNLIVSFAEDMRVILIMIISMRRPL